MISDTLQALDERITLAINSLHFEAGDHFWQFFSSAEVWFPLYAAVLFVMVRRLGWKKGLMAVLAMVLTVLACDQFADLVKNSVCRLRPCYNSDMVTAGLHMLEARGGYYGFFSGHAANAFGFAAASSICFDADKNHRYDVYQWFIFIWAALVGLSRIFAGKHYFGDVLVGALVGLVFGCAIATVFRKIVTRPGWSSPS
jgi:undecaprenyl-diphosphatase